MAYFTVMAFSHTLKHVLNSGVFGQHLSITSFTLNVFSVKGFRSVLEKVFKCCLKGRLFQNLCLECKGAFRYKDAVFPAQGIWLYKTWPY